MNRVPFYIPIITGLIVLSGSALGQTVPAKLSIRQALDMAITVNPTLRQSSSDLGDTRVRAGLARIETSLSASAEAKQTRGEIGNDTNAVITGKWDRSDPKGAKSSVEFAPIGIGGDRGSLSVQHRIPLNRGKDKLSTKLNDIMDADSAFRIQEKQIFLTKQATVLSVIGAYLNAVLAREQIKVQEKALSVAEDAATSARKRADAGLIAELEVSRADISVAQTRDDLNGQIQAYKGAVDTLMKSIGQGIGQNPELIDSVPETTQPLPALETAVSTALQNRVELSVYDQQISDRSRKTNITADQLKPALDAVAGFSSFNNRTGVLGSSIFNRNSLTIGLEYTVSLDKRIITAEKEISQKDLALYTDLRAYEMEKIAADVRGAYRSVETSRDSLNILGQNLNTTLENLRLAQRMVDEGLSSNREVLDAQTAVTRVESGILSAKLNLYMAGLNLKAAMGEDLTKTVMQ